MHHVQNMHTCKLIVSGQQNNCVYSSQSSPDPQKKIYIYILFFGKNTSFQVFPLVTSNHMAVPAYGPLLTLSYGLFAMYIHA